MRELERQRLLEDHRVDPLAELGAEQRLAERDAALRARERGDEQGFRPDQQQGVRGQRIPGRGVGADRGDHGVHDQGADPGDAGRQHAAEERQDAERDAEPAVRGPHELECVAAVAEHAEEATRQLRLRCRERVPAPRAHASSSSSAHSGGRPIAALRPATTIGRSIRIGSLTIASIHSASVSDLPAYFDS